MPFRFEVTNVAIDDGHDLYIQGTVLGGSVSQGELIRLPTAEGVDLVARVLLVSTHDGLGWGRWWRPGVPVILLAYPTHRFDLLRRRRPNAESTSPFKIGVTTSEPPPRALPRRV